MAKFTEFINDLLSNSKQQDIKELINKSSLNKYHGLQVTNNVVNKKLIVDLKEFYYKKRGYNDDSLISFIEKEEVILLENLFNNKRVYFVDNIYNMNIMLANEILKGNLSLKTKKFYVIMRNDLGVKQIHCFNKRKYDEVSVNKNLFFYKYYICLNKYDEKLIEARKILRDINE